MKKSKEVEKKYGYLIIDGEYYEWETKDGKHTLKKVSEKRLEKELKRAEEIVDKLEKSADVRKILMEAVMQIDNKEQEKLHNMLYNSKKRYVPKTREHFCVDMKIGNFILPIIE